MSVQRFSAYHSGDPSRIGLWADTEGHWVTYAEHARIVAEMEQAHAAALAAAVDEYARGVEQIIAERVAETVRYELLVQPPAAPRTLTADDRLAIARRVDAALAAMPTGFWINANTEEAQAHKRYVRDALAALIHDGEATP